MSKFILDLNRDKIKKLPHHRRTWFASACVRACMGECGGVSAWVLAWERDENWLRYLCYIYYMHDCQTHNSLFSLFLTSIERIIRTKAVALPTHDLFASFAFEHARILSRENPSFYTLLLAHTHTRTHAFSSHSRTLYNTLALHWVWQRRCDLTSLQ